MVTGYEVGMYRNIDQISDSLARIAVALERIAEAWEDAE